VSAALTAAQLRQAFDSAFAEAAQPRDEDVERVAAIGCGDALLAIAVRDVSGVHRLPPLVRLPGAHAAVAGLGIVEGALVPVFDLAAILGWAPDLAACRWLALCHARRIGLAFARFDGVASVRLPEAAPAARRQPLASRFLVDGIERTLIDIAPIVELIAQATGSTPRPNGDRT
jgi:purine-binding chemotaxis protein CheW